MPVHFDRWPRFSHYYFISESLGHLGTSLYWCFAFCIAARRLSLHINLKMFYIFSFQAVGWTYHKDEVVPCDDSKEFNIQYWQRGTCLANIPIYSTDTWVFLNRIFTSEKFCGFYIGGKSSVRSPFLSSYYFVIIYFRKIKLRY